MMENPIDRLRKSGRDGLSVNLDWLDQQLAQDPEYTAWLKSLEENDGDYCEEEEN
jgi:hypothetical protein